MTRRAVALMMIAISTVLCLAYSGEKVFLWILLMIFFSCAYALGSIYYTLRCMRIHYALEHQELTSGERTRLKIYVSNGGILPLAHVELRHDNTRTLLQSSATVNRLKTIASSGFIPSVMWRDTKSIQREIAFPYRGVYSPGAISGELSDIFGLFRFRIPSRYLADHADVTVLPQIGAANIEVRNEGLSIEGDSSRFGEQDPYTILDIRAYQPGDALKRIHWKLSARTRQLQSKLFADAQSASIMVFLDLSRHSLSNEAAAEREDRICKKAAAVCKEVLQSGAPLRLIAYGKTRKEYIGATPGDLLHFQRFLAGLKFNCTYGIHQVIQMEMESLPAVSQIVVVVRTVSAALSAYLASLSMQGYRVTLAIVAEEAAEGKLEADPDGSDMAVDAGVPHREEVAPYAS